jgi:hypothetical protein
MPSGGPARDHARFAVLSFGRSGSTWLGRAFTRAEAGMATFHAPIAHLAGWSLLGEPTFVSPYVTPPTPRLIEILRPYTDWVRHRERQFDVLGEVHPLLFFAFRQLPELLPPRRALLVRNGVQVTHATAFGWLCNGTARERSWILGAAPAKYARASDEERLFAAVCAYWADHLDLCEPLVRDEVLRLEDLTRRPAALQAAHVRLTGREVTEDWCVKVSAVRVNRCVPGDNSPANLFWNVWSEAMREMFVELCGAAMARLGYELPARGAAPSSADLRPRRPREETPLPFGPLASLWCFLSNPRCGPVIVCGEPRYARVAASILGPVAWLLDRGEPRPGGAADGVKRIALGDAPRLQPAGVFVADPSPDRAAHALLRESMPDAEYVEMLPGAIADDDLELLSSAGHRYAEYVEPAPGGLGPGAGASRGGGRPAAAARPVVLVSLPPWGLRVPPLGVCYLAEFLRVHDWPVEVFDGNLLLQGAVGPRAADMWVVCDQLRWLEPRYEREIAPWIRPHLRHLVDDVLAAEPLLLGISCGSVLSRAVAEELVLEVRRIRPETLIVGGGQGVIGVADRAPFRRDGFDYFVEGEGEHALLEIVERVAAGRGDLGGLGGLPGVVPWRATRGDPYECFSPRPIEADLTRLPFPTFRELALEQYSHVNLLMSRGCPRNCQFCSNPARYGAYRSLPPERVFAAMAYHYERGQRVFEFNDVLLNADMARLERLADLILEAGWRVEWTGAAIARKEMTEGFLAKLRRAGVRRLRYGVESFSEDVLRSMKKGREAALALDVLRRTREAGIETQVFLIVGFPGETEARFRETLEAVGRHAGAIADNITVSGCMIPDAAPVGYDAERFAIAKTGPLPLVTWEGADGNTHEERADRICRATGLLTARGFDRLHGDEADEASAVLVCLPDDEGGSRRQQALAAWAVAERETRDLGIRTVPVDLHEALDEAVRARDRQRRPVGYELLAEFDRGSPGLPRCLEERLDTILCSRAAYAVLWVGSCNDERAARFARALHRTDPGLCVLVAGAGAPSGGQVPAPFDGVVLGDLGRALHALVRPHRVGRAPPRARPGLYELAREGIAPTPWWTGVLELLDVTAPASDRSRAEDADGGRWLELPLRFLRASRPLRFRLELGARVFGSLAGGAVPVDLVMPGGRVRAGSRLALAAWIPPWFVGLPRRWIKLRAFETYPDGREVEVLHALPSLSVEDRTPPIGGSSPPGPRDLQPIVDAVRAAAAPGGPGARGAAPWPRLALARLDDPAEPGAASRGAGGEILVQWPLSELRRPRPAGGRATGSDEGGAVPAAGPAAPTPMSPVARRLADNVTLVHEIMTRLAAAPRSPLPGWACTSFQVDESPREVTVRVELARGREVARIEVVAGDSPAEAFARARYVKLRLAPGPAPVTAETKHALQALCALLDHYLRRAGA